MVKVLFRAVLLPSPPKEDSKTRLEVLVCLYRWRKMEIAADQLNRFPQETCLGEVHMGVGAWHESLGPEPSCWLICPLIPQSASLQRRILINSFLKFIRQELRPKPSIPPLDVLGSLETTQILSSQGRPLLTDCI